MLYPNCRPTCIIDGHSFVVLVNLELRHLGLRLFAELPVRMLHIRAPDINATCPEIRAKALEAKAKLISIIEDKPLIIDAKGTDTDKRPLVEVWLASEGKKALSVNQMLLNSRVVAPMSKMETLEMLVGDPFTKAQLIAHYVKFPEAL